MTNYYHLATSTDTTTACAVTYDVNNTTMYSARTTSTTALSVKNSSGQHISILNHYGGDNNLPSGQQRCQKDTAMIRRKYRCTKPGCNKIFTTSGHLSRHHRIHTGEKNFQCFYPGCPSRFSRQDNMMQHYRTHLSPRSRRLPCKPSIAAVAAAAAAAAAATVVRSCHYRDAVPEPRAAIDYIDDPVRLPQLQLCPPLRTGEPHRRESKVVGHDYHHHHHHRHYHLHQQHYKKPQPLEPPSPPTTPPTASTLLHLSHSFSSHSRLPSLSSSPTSSASEYII